MSPDKRPVQSCISAVSFPKTLDKAEYIAMNRIDDCVTDMDLLLNREMSGANWSMPAWISDGDIAFIYHTKSAKLNVRRVRKEFEKQTDVVGLNRLLHPGEARKQRLLSELLSHAEEQADRYSGTIFACAVVDGNAYREDEYIEERHYHGRSFAQLWPVHIFDHPLSHDEFSKYIRIKNQGVITELSKTEFNELRDHLAVQNSLPQWLENAEFSESGFYNITSKNWATIACTPETRFLREKQIRKYFLDYLLQELKDERTPLLKECRCMRSGRQTGRADYFIKLHGQWVPVEAKVNINVEANLPNQLRKYVHVDTFTPTTGRYKDREYIPDNTGLCLVGDQSGIYVTIDGEFVECSPEQPMWPRTEINSEMIPAMRERLRTFY